MAQTLPSISHRVGSSGSDLVCLGVYGFCVGQDLGSCRTCRSTRSFPSLLPYAPGTRRC